MVCGAKGETVDNSRGYVVVERVLVVSSEDVISLPRAIGHSFTDYNHTSV